MESESRKEGRWRRRTSIVESNYVMRDRMIGMGWQKKGWWNIEAFVLTDLGAESMMVFPLLTALHHQKILALTALDHQTILLLTAFIIIIIIIDLLHPLARQDGGYC